MADKILFFVAALVLTGGLAGFYFFSDVMMLARVVGLLLAIGCATWLLMLTALGKSIWQHGQESYTEVRKVVWPTRSETIRTTGLVMVMVVVIAILLWLLDMGLISGVRYLTGQGV
jgi:preprotein translocase subunit SecE